MRSEEAVQLTQASLSQLRAGVEGLGRCARLGLDADALGGLIRAAFSQRNGLDAAITSLVGALDRHSRADDGPGGHSSCAAWLRDELHLNDSAAYGQVRLARQLQYLPDTSAAFARGDLSYQHAVAVARTVEAVVLGGGPAADAETMSLREASACSPRDLLLWGRRLRHELNPDELAGQEQEDHRRRWVRLSQAWDGGSDLDGHLDAERGSTLKTALQGPLRPRARDDERTPVQRRADALVEIARRCLDSGQL